MSIQAIAYVLEHSEARGLARLVLLAIANHADALGMNAFPSVDQIAREARVHRATVFRSIAELERDGELEVVRGRGAGHTSLYQITFKKVAPCDLLRSHPATNKGRTVRKQASFIKPLTTRAGAECDLTPLTPAERARGKQRAAAARGVLRPA